MGGMSVVWRGYDETLGRPVAVKVLSPRIAEDQVFRDRLRQEALAAARLCHPHITGVFDFGESPLSERLTVPYVVMELNDGESVASRLARHGPLPWRDAVTVAAEVASALATAHARGLVHRDVTPANVMLTGSGAKVVDFGISAIVGQRDAAPDGSLLGTPAYLAPERLAGAQVSAATDVYALGLLLYRTLTGRLPWPAGTTAEALRAHLYADPGPLPELPGLPAGVRELCLSCLAKRPDDRPGAADVARKLAAAVGLHPIIPPLPAREGGAEPVRGSAVPVWSPVASPGAARSPGGLGRVVLAYLGLPVEGPRLSANVLRLRAGLRLGSALRLGRARPLGGGLFAGGGVARDLLTGRGLRSARRPRGGLAGPGWLPGRRRVPAALATAALLLVTGVAWAASREPPAAEQARAAGAAPPAVAPGGRECAVRYQLKRDSGREYEAQLTVATSADVGRAPWRVQFAYPGSQRLTRPPQAVTQKGRKVTAKGSGRLRVFTLRGRYRGTNPLPLAFTLDGHRCRAELLAGGTARDGGGGAVSEAAGKPSGDRGAGKRRRPARERELPRRRASAGTPRPADPSGRQATTGTSTIAAAG